MNNFRFTKIIAGVSPILAKETVLSKIINMVDAFRITLSKGFDDNNKKYIDTLMKLDNSKTVILETKGIDVRIKNIWNISVKKGEKWTAEYSEYAQEGNNKIYIDYAELWELSEGSILKCTQSNVSFKVLSTNEDTAEVEIVEVWKWEIIQYDRVLFDGQSSNIEEITDRDKKDILWWLEYWAHVLWISCCNSAAHVESFKEFLDSNNAKEMKIFAKIENDTWLKRLDEILEIADWIILVIDSLWLEGEKLVETIHHIKKEWKPVLVTTIQTEYSQPIDKTLWKQIQELWKEAIDWVMLETFLVEEEVFDTIEKTWELLNDCELKLNSRELKRFEKEWDFEVRDYIIYNAFRSAEELWVKTAICFTENWYTASRFSSLAPKIPVITFTQSKETYRYLSLVWGVKWYKISQSFNYENLKKIGKEMVRMIFKWNISLDDKIIILQADETISPDKNDMINGQELYNFKNI